MGWTNPHTWVAGELVGASALNTHLRDNLSYLLAPNAAQRISAAGTLTTTSTTFASLGTAWALALTTYGGHVTIGAQLPFTYAGVANHGSAFFGIDVDGTVYTAQMQLMSGTGFAGLSINKLITGLGSGAHTLTLKWRVAPGATTGTLDPSFMPIEFYAKEN